MSSFLFVLVATAIVNVSVASLTLVAGEEPGPLCPDGVIVDDAHTARTMSSHLLIDVVGIDLPREKSDQKRQDRVDGPHDND
jgi:hypothetical protein